MDQMDQRIRTLEEKGVVIVDPRQVYIAPEVDLDRVYEGSTLFPGTRLTGARTLIGSGAKIGTEGPAVIHDCVVGARAEVASGFLTEAALLPRAKAGANSHYRAGTILEEEASTAHSVGLKQTILMYGVTLGSLINMCDALLSGGRSRSDHTEVGSGFIHFNFTPWGEKGDKATPSLVGNVTEGVFLDQPRIFLGGMSGMVGPRSIGFGALTAAGQVVRHDVPVRTMHAETGRDMEKPWSPSEARLSAEHLEKVRSKNIEFLAQLYALKAWYEQVRLKRSRLWQDGELSLVLAGAIETIQMCIHERVSRYNSFAGEWSLLPLDEAGLNGQAVVLEAAVDWKPGTDYGEWVHGLAENEKQALHTWLADSAEKIRAYCG